jgi:hypothetical protein
VSPTPVGVPPRRRGPALLEPRVVAPVLARSAACSPAGDVAADAAARSLSLSLSSVRAVPSLSNRVGKVCQPRDASSLLV